MYNESFKLAVSIGVNPVDFEYLLPSQLDIMAEDYNNKLKYEINKKREAITHDYYVAWLTAKLSRAKKIPDFDKIKPKFVEKVKDEYNGSRFRMADYEIEIHLNRFKKEGRLLLIG